MPTEKTVRVTLELPNRFVALLMAKANLSGWNRWLPDCPEGEHLPQLDAGDIVAWLVALEARGATEEVIHAATPMEWRNAAPELIHTERRVYQDGQQIAGPKLVLRR